MLVNGKSTTPIPALDRGLQYGDGLFETLAVIEGSPCLWPRHMERLRQGCERLAIPLPDTALLLKEVRQESTGHPKAVVKIIITRGEGGRGYRPDNLTRPTRLIHTSPWPDYPMDMQTRGVAVRLCSTRLGCNPALARIKHLNRLEQVLAQQEWSDPEVAEGLMLDTRGRVIEGTMSNLFVWRNGELKTADLTHCGVAGVMRGLVVDTACSLDIPVVSCELSLANLQEADALFLTNSLIGICPVRELDGKGFDVTSIPSKLSQTVMEQAFAPPGLNPC